MGIFFFFEYFASHTLKGFFITLILVVRHALTRTSFEFQLDWSTAIKVGGNLNRSNFYLVSLLFFTIYNTANTVGFLRFYRLNTRTEFVIFEPERRNVLV